MEDGPDLDHVRRALREHDRDAERERDDTEGERRDDPPVDRVRESLREYDRDRAADDEPGKPEGDA